MSRVGLATTLAIAALLRGLPLLAPPLAVELDAAYPKHAVLAVVERDWRELSPVHGALLSDVLRAAATAAYGAGRIAGRYDERVDLLADFVRAPLPFVVGGRVLVLLASLAGIVLAAGTAVRLGGGRAGLAAAALVATSFIHVRESLHVWPDAPAATMAIATVAAALAHLERGTWRSAVLLGGLAGLSLSAKLSLVPLALPVALSLWLGGSAQWPARARRGSAAVAAALAAFLVTTPYVVLDWPTFSLLMRVQASGSFASGATVARLGWPSLSVLTLGAGPLALALVGLVVASRRAPRPTLVVAAFPIAYLAMLARANPYARYFAIAAPFVAALGGVGAAAGAERLAPRRARLATAAVVALACAVPAWRCFEYVALLLRDDTRVTAGAWLADHVAPGTAVTLPNIVGYANPVVAPDGFVLRIDYPDWHEALRTRGLGDPARTYHLRFQGMLSNYDGAFAPRDPIVVTAAHPAPSAALSTPAVNAERLRAAGYVILAIFEGVSDPPPSGLVYDPLEADYTPLAGGSRVAAPGPTITIWRAPASSGIGDGPGRGLSGRPSPGGRS